jgi:hypothetical protein
LIDKHLAAYDPGLGAAIERASQEARIKHGMAAGQPSAAEQQ